jgi:hypothetical protein
MIKNTIMMCVSNSSALNFKPYATSKHAIKAICLLAMVFFSVPAMSQITGTLSVCAGSTTALSDGSTGEIGAAATQQLLQLALREL